MLSLGSFSPRKDAKDGLAYWCTPCKTHATKNGPNRKNVVKAYYDKNSALCIQRSVLSMQKKPEYYAEKSANWVANNKEKVLSLRKAAYQKNVAQEILRVRRRQNKIKSCMPWITQAHHAEMQGLYRFCQIFKGHEVDHVIPLNGKTVSGLHVPANLQVLTVRENRRKQNKFVELAVS